MKIGIFTDSHYSSQKLTCGNRYNSKSLDKIRGAFAEFEAQNCDLVICLGDLIDSEDSHSKEIDNLKQVAEIIKCTPMPTACLMGNHDAFAFTVSAFYEILDGCEPRDRCINGKNLIFLDACHFKGGKHYAPGDTDWTDTYYPDTDTLESYLRTLKGDTYIFMHQNIDPTVPENHRLYNAEEIRGILVRSGIVKAVYQGHYHLGSFTLRDGIDYITLPAMCQIDKGYFIREI